MKNKILIIFLITSILGFGLLDFQAMKFNTRYTNIAMHNRIPKNGLELETATLGWSGNINATDVVSKESTGDSYNPSIAIDGSGNVHVVWADDTVYGAAGADRDIFYNFWNVTSGSWNVTGVVSTESTGDSYNPALAVDGSGNVHVTWYDYTDYGGAGADWDIFYKFWNATSGTWSGNINATDVVSTESTSSAMAPSMAVDGSGNVHVAWHGPMDYGGSGADWDVFYKFWNTTSGTWSVTDVVSTESTNNSYSPSLTVDGSGFLHVVWRDYTDYCGAGSDLDIFYKTQMNIPTSNHPNDLITSINGSETINWTLYDDFGPGQYRVWANDTNGNYYVWIDWTSWINETSLDVPINRTAPGIYNYTIEYYDSYGQFGTPDTVIVTITDALPTSYPPLDIITSASGTETINWTLYDDFGPGQYRVWANDTNGNYYVWIDWTSWINETSLDVPINRTAPGIYNYTIEYYDSYGQFGIPDTVIVNITQPPSDEPNTQIILILLIVLMAQPPDIPYLIIIVAGCGVLIIIVVIYIKKR